MSVSCQPVIENPCLDANTITSGGGQIVEQVDGTVSVWVNNPDGLQPYTNINTKPCCELLGYTFDIDNQKCLWDDSISCDTCELKIVVNPNGDDGDYFYFNSGDTCSLNIALDYLFKFDCSVLTSGETVSQEALDIIAQIDDLTVLLEDIQLECASLSAQCIQYTAIYEGMCYPIQISTQVLDPESSDSTASDFRMPGSDFILTDSPFGTICCLTQEGLVRWESILGEIKYNAWLQQNGCSTAYYTIQQASILFNEGNELAIDNNGFNPYLEQTNQSLCIKNEAYSEMVEICSQYDDCLNQISEIETELANLQGQLDAIPTALCDDPIANLENFQAWFSLDVETDVPMLYETVYEEEIFNIGEGNLMQYIIDRGNNTGILISGDTGILPAFSVDSTCDYDELCKIYRDNFMRELYLSQYVGVYGEPQNNIENAELLDLMGNWYNSEWLNYSAFIDDPSVIEKLQNRKIRISIKVNTCCLDFGLLLDKIKVTQNCDKLDGTVIRLTQPIGFDLERIIDNKKSWVNSETLDRRLFELPWRGTDYRINNYKLGINTKEIDLNLDPALAIEGDVYNFIYNNPCALDCSSGSTSVDVNVDLDFNSIYLQQILSCSGCSLQYQFQDDDCYDFMNGVEYEFQFQNGGITGTTIISGVWGISAMVDNTLIYNNPMFYSGYTAPTQNDYINELANLANTIDCSLIYSSGTTAQIISDYSCDIGLGLSNKNLKIDLNLDIIINY